MAINPTGLGKGLDALIRESGESRGTAGVQTVAVRDIMPNPKQPRRAFNKQSLEELAESIRSQGLLQPLLIRPAGPARPGKYQIVAGERRWRACQLAGLTEVPVLIRTLSEQDTLAAALIENLQREDLNPMEEAAGLQKLKEEFGLSQDELAKKIGKSRSAIANSVRLLTLPEEAQKTVAQGRLSAGHARTLLSLSDAAAQTRLLELILAHNLSVREAEGQAALWKETGKFDFAGTTGAAGDWDHGPQPAPDSDQGAPQAAGSPENTPESTPPKTRAQAGKKPQSVRLLEAQNKMGTLFKVPVRVVGKEDKGKITFSFNSREELDALLQRLSTAALEGARHATLTGESRRALNAQDHAVLDGKKQHALEGSDAQALTHRDSAALTHRTAHALEPASDAAPSGAGAHAGADAGK